MSEAKEISAETLWIPGRFQPESGLIVFLNGIYENSVSMTNVWYHSGECHFY